MGKSEVGSPKWAAKQMRARGLQRLRWFCQACEKQCRDEHGYRLHTQSPSHTARAEGARAQQARFSAEFEAAFVRELRAMARGAPRAVSANRVYNELIRDPGHVHMNATRFRSLTGFVRHLEAAGIVRIVAAEPELIIEHIDVEAEARARARAAHSAHAPHSAHAAEQTSVAALLRAQHDEFNETTETVKPEAEAANRLSGRRLEHTPSGNQRESAHAAAPDTAAPDSRAEPRAKIGFSLKKMR